MTRAKVRKALVEIMTKDLPPGVTEADRRAKLATICVMTNVINGEAEWRSVWSEVMAATGCGTWNEIMNTGKH